MTSRLSLCPRIALALSTFMLALSSVNAESIGKQLQKHSPQIVEYLNEQNVKTVGVLKFRVKKPGEKLSDSVGPLNSLLADRLEVALILANPFDESRQLNIIKDASSQAAKIPGASHLNASGRAAFFGRKFELSWGSDRLSADAFLTGIVQVHDDNLRATIGILCFSKNGGKIDRVGEVFDVDLDATSLGEMGESFMLRGAFDGGSAKLSFEENQEQRQTLVRLEAAKVKSQRSTFPLADPSAPIRLEITYDGRPVPVEMRDGRAFVPEPNENQRVEFAIVRNASSGPTFGVVLKVNGENTLYRQTNPDVSCAQWIMKPTRSRTVVRGYQLLDRKTIEKFKVLSQAESATRAMDYGRNVGQIQVTVFSEQTLEKPRASSIAEEEEEEDMIAMLRGIHPKERPSNLSALKRKLRKPGEKFLATRGLIDAGERTDNKVNVVQFKPDPTPIMSATITYYTP